MLEKRQLRQTHAKVLLSSSGANSSRLASSVSGLNKSGGKKYFYSQARFSAVRKGLTALCPGQPDAWHFPSEAYLTGSSFGCIRPGGLPSQSTVNVLRVLSKENYYES